MDAFDKTVEGTTLLILRSADGKEKIDFKKEIGDLATDVIGTGISSAVGQELSDKAKIGINLVFANTLKQKLPGEFSRKMIVAATKNTIKLLSAMNRGTITERMVMESFADQLISQVKAVPGAGLPTNIVWGLYKKELLDLLNPNN